MTWPSWYFLVGAIAAIRGQDAGCIGMLLLAVAWPAFALAGLAHVGLSAIRR